MLNYAFRVLCHLGAWHQRKSDGMGYIYLQLARTLALSSLHTAFPLSPNIIISRQFIKAVYIPNLSETYIIKVKDSHHGSLSLCTVPSSPFPPMPHPPYSVRPRQFDATRTDRRRSDHACDFVLCCQFIQRSQLDVEFCCWK